jgi:hypothetical protein
MRPILAQDNLMTRLLRIALLLCCMPTLLNPAQSTQSQGRSSKIWVGKHQEIEAYLKAAECVSMTTLALNRVARCALPPGGPVDRMAWKTSPPGPSGGFVESYKTEIAAYELDKLLKMDMVPPTVERQLEGDKGAAQLWVENVVDAMDPAKPDRAERAHWESDIIRMTMFDNLIGNRARNLRNMLRDRAWNLILIDHSRAFGTDVGLPGKTDEIDEAYWSRIEKLTPGQLNTALSAWLNAAQIKAILDRREKMRADFRVRVKQRRIVPSMKG